MTERRDALRYAIREILIDHLMDIEDRRKERTERTWPDESDIYDRTEARLREVFGDIVLQVPLPGDPDKAREKAAERLAKHGLGQ